MEEVLIAVGIGAAALIAAIVAGIAGFGGAVIMLPILTWAFGIREAVPIVTVSQLIGNLSRTWFNREGISPTLVGWFALGAVPTAAIGGVVFASAPTTALARAIGAYLLLVVVCRHSGWWHKLRIGPRGFLPVGAAAGFISAIVGMVGPFIAPFFLAYGLVKSAYVGTEALATVTMHVTKLGAYGSYDLLEPFILLAGLGIGAVMFAGSYIGRQLLDRVPERWFPYLIEGVLAVAGVLFLVRG
ncbi:MAG: sulfite exporter TauE/SafE family protein [Chloroflexota bacterium]